MAQYMAYFPMALSSYDREANLINSGTAPNYQSHMACRPGFYSTQPVHRAQENTSPRVSSHYFLNKRSASYTSVASSEGRQCPVKIHTWWITSFKKSSEENQLSCSFCQINALFLSSVQKKPIILLIRQHSAGNANPMVYVTVLAPSTAATSFCSCSDIHSWKMFLQPLLSSCLLLRKDYKLQQRLRNTIVFKLFPEFLFMLMEKSVQAFRSQLHLQQHQCRS